MMEENRITAITKEKNPFDFERAKVLINDAVKRDALTAKHRFAYL